MCLCSAAVFHKYASCLGFDPLTAAPLWPSVSPQTAAVGKKNQVILDIS